MKKGNNINLALYCSTSLHACHAGGFFFFYLHARPAFLPPQLPRRWLPYCATPRLLCATLPLLLLRQLPGEKGGSWDRCFSTSNDSQQAIKPLHKSVTVCKRQLSIEVKLGYNKVTPSRRGPSADRHTAAKALIRSTFLSLKSPPRTAAACTSMTPVYPAKHTLSLGMCAVSHLDVPVYQWVMIRSLPPSFPNLNRGDLNSLCNLFAPSEPILK